MVRKVFAFCLALLATLVVGCSHAKEPCTPADLNGCIVDHVEIIGAHGVPGDVIESKIATAETNGLFENVPVLGGLDAVSRTDERFDRFVFERDLTRIERLYRAEGYYQAKVTAGRARREPLKEDHDRPPPDKMTARDKEMAAKHERVLVDIVVDEGPQVLLAADPVLAFAERDKTVKDDLVASLTKLARKGFKKGSGFTEDLYESARRNLTAALTDAGYAYAHVEKGATIDVPGSAAKVTYTITTGPACTFGKIDFVGLAGIPEWLMRPALGFHEGDDFSTKKLEAAQVVLADFNVFGSISIDPATNGANGARPPKVPIRITVERAKKGTIKLGAGGEAGDVVAVRGVVSWQDNDLFGILDRINVELRPRLVFYPLQLNTIFTKPPFIQVVPEFTFRAQYTMPIPFDPATRIFSLGEASIARPLNATTPTSPSSTENILGYQEVAGQFGLQRKFFSSRFFVFPSFNIQFVNPISYNLDTLPAGLQSLNLRNLELFLELDLRRGNVGWDALRPRSGFYASTDFQVGGYFLGGDASDLRVRPEVRFFIPLWRKGVLAARTGTGLLYAHNYGAVLDHSPSTDAVMGHIPTRNATDRDVQITSIRGLYSGGPSSNRGYNFNEIGPHRVVDDSGFFLSSPESIGGRTEWDASVELRVTFSDTLGGVLFVDASDVTAGFAEYRITHPHISTGIGIRYDTPVGPLRVDLGLRIPGAQVIGQTTVASCLQGHIAGTAYTCTTDVIDEGDPATLLTLPLAFSIAIGNAF